MNNTRFWLVLGALLLVACGEQGEDATEKTSNHEKKVEYVAFGEFKNPEDSLPRLVFFEGGQVSLNDRCAVRKVRLNPKMPPAYVNGRPIGFC